MESDFDVGNWTDAFSLLDSHSEGAKKQHEERIVPPNKQIGESVSGSTRVMR